MSRLLVVNLREVKEFIEPNYSKDIADNVYPRFVFFYLHEYARLRNLSCLDPFIFPTSFGLSWYRTQVHLPNKLPLLPLGQTSQAF